jgi:CubicO group peptidase (beta-lactamase class C family)
MVDWRSQMNRLSVAIGMVGILIASQAPAQVMSVAQPEKVGLSGPKLQAIGEAVQRHIDAKAIPGAITLVARNGRIAWLDARGNVTPTMPLQEDTVFWVASMTKPLVATAVMMMVDAGKVSLDDPVSQYIPEFAAPRQVRVLKPGSPPPNPQDRNAPKPEYELVPAERPILVRHLLTHTSGLQSIGVPNDSLVPIAVGDTLATHIPKLASATLEFQPGSKWFYSNATGFDVLARVVEVASGQTFYEFVQRRILDPLGMKSSSFGPRADLAARTMEVAPQMAANPCVNAKTYACGSAGMWISAEDYARFAQMLLNNGEFGGKRLLSRKAVATMVTNHTGRLFPGTSGVPGADKGVVMGLSVVVVEDSAASGLAVPTGSFGWDGVGSRRFWVIPQERMVIVMLVPSGAAAPVHRDVERAAMAAITGR